MSSAHIEAEAATAPLAELDGISKRFGRVQACDDVHLALNPGEIVGLLGENGAGKTTCMNILFGLYEPDRGAVRLHGRSVRLRSPAGALAAGVGMVHQHFHLVPRHTVLENLMVGRRGLRGRLDRAGARARLADIDARYGLGLDADARVEALSVGEQQKLEIVKALFSDVRLLILDEPTSVLTPQQSESLFDALRALARDGVGVVVISHRLKEVLSLVGRIVVMRRGRVVREAPNDGTLAPRRLAQWMCGRDIEPVERDAVTAGETLLRCEGIRADGLHGVSLRVSAGEILGLAGVSGNGQRQLAEVLAGVTHPAGGVVEVLGRPVRRFNRRALRSLGVAYVPEDRLGAGLLPGLPLVDSIMLAHYHAAPFSRGGWLRWREARRLALEWMARFDVRAANERVRTGTLSGGNLQRALLARELALRPRVLVAAQPTQGLDAGGIEFVHRTLLDLRRSGAGVLLVSEDLDELLGLSDRIAVMYEGRIAGELSSASATRAELGLMMTGAGRAA